MNEKFNFQRFWTYFKYDLKQMWRNHSTTAILIGGSVAILYIIWVMASLVFAHEWTSPMVWARVVVLAIAFCVLEFYQAHTYGHLTDKKAGSAWLMVPASRGEKYLSMLLMTLVVIPLLFFAVFFLLDGLLSLVDPTYGTSILSGFGELVSKFKADFQSIMNEIPVSMTPGTLTFLTILSIFCNFLFFLLCGICFKKNKIVMGIVILFGASFVFSILGGLVLPIFADKLTTLSMSEDQALRLFVGTMNVSIVLEVLLTLGLGWGVWYRIKTLQH